MGTNSRKWTILIYAAGNNDLDDEIYNSFQLLKACLPAPEYKIIIQLARLAQRQQQPSYVPDNTTYSSINRYCIDSSSTKLIKVLYGDCMANPHTLLDFVVWGIKEYPAEFVMVILSGHSAGVIGTMVDWGQDQNSKSIMSLQGLARTFSVVQHVVDKSIDIVVMDTCFMNMVEIWYELAVAAGQPIKYLLIPAGGDLARKGLPLDIVIRSLGIADRAMLTIENTVNTLSGILTQCVEPDNWLSVVKLLPELLVELKVKINLLAEFLLKHNAHNLLELDQYRKKFSQASVVAIPYFCNYLAERSMIPLSVCDDIQILLRTIMLSPAVALLPETQNTSPSIYFPANSNQYLVERSSYYCLAFVSNNSWGNLLEIRNKIPNLKETCKAGLAGPSFPVIQYTGDDLLPY